jgi:ribosome-associated translation inhibitor RaiA
VYAAAECEDLYSGIDQCVAAAKRQLEKLKDRS